MANCWNSHVTLLCVWVRTLCLSVSLSHTVTPTPTHTHTHKHYHNCSHTPGSRRTERGMDDYEALDLHDDFDLVENTDDSNFTRHAPPEIE